MKKLLVAIVASATLGISQGANAALINSDFLTAGDDYLVTDTVTDLEWLTPYYTRGHSYNDSFVQGLITTYGFRYATGQEAFDMITLNFNNPVTTHPGNAAGGQSAIGFFDVFGINQYMTCGDPVLGSVDCTRTQGFTSTTNAPGTILSYGMIQWGANGYMLSDLQQSSLIATQQLGSWLVRPAQEDPAQVPTPPTLWLTILGLTGLAGLRRRQARG